jgi:hypothetical protein
VGQSEWRTNKQFQLVSKGRVLDLNLDPDNNWLMVEVVERMMSRWNKRDEATLITTTDQCDQEGCSAPSTVTYKMKALYNGGCDPIDPYITDSRPLIRKFCDEHKKRGDGYYEDSDDNYVIITGRDEGSVQ